MNFEGELVKVFKAVETPIEYSNIEMVVAIAEIMEKTFGAMDEAEILEEIRIVNEYFRILTISEYYWLLNGMSQKI